MSLPLKLKKLQIYLEKNNLIKESKEINKIIKKSFLGGLAFWFLSALTGCSGKYAHLIFRVKVSAKSFTNDTNSPSNVEVFSTLPGRVYQFEGSFHNYSDDDKREAHLCLADLQREGFLTELDRQQLYRNGEVSEDNVKIEKCKNLKFSYYKLEFDVVGNWDPVNSAIIHDKDNAIDENKINDQELLDHPQNKSQGNQWILDNGVFVTPNSLASSLSGTGFLEGSLDNIKYDLARDSSRLENAFDRLDVKETEIVF